MAPQYAKDQPAGFKNRIQNVAIIGASGQVGRSITRSLLDDGKHTVTAITRKESDSVFPDGVKVAKVDYNDEQSLVSAMTGQEMLIMTLSTQAAPDIQIKLAAAAAKAGVPWVMPNCWGADLTNESLSKESLIGPGYLEGIKAIEEPGVSSWVSLACSFWYEYSLAIPASYGFDFHNKKVTFFDEGNTKINTSTWEQCGRAVSSLLSFKVLPEDENDKSVTISQWRNKQVYMSSFTVSQRDMLDSVHRVMGTTDADWTIEHENSTERYKRGMEILQSGDRTGFVMCLYTRVFYPNGDGDFGTKHGLANGVLGLPEENLDESTKKAIETALGRK